VDNIGHEILREDGIGSVGLVRSDFRPCTARRYNNWDTVSNDYLHVILDEVTGRAKLVNYVSSKYFPGGLALECSLGVRERCVQWIPFGLAVNDGAGCRRGHAVVPTLLLIRGTPIAGSQRAHEPDVHVVPERFLQ